MQLYQDIFQKCIDNDINIKFFKNKSHNGCGGWVSEKEFVCAYGSDNFLEILVHESCHLDQLVEESPIWFHKDICGENCNIWDVDWGEKHPRKYLKAFKKICELEVDCDIRAIEKIKKYKLPIDIEEYTISSNIYHACYYYFHKYKCFYKMGKKPCDDPDLIKLFPSDRIVGFEECWKPNKKLGEFIKNNHKKL
jgi:hypothetical protein